jgi:hypothetical protein
MAPPVLAMLPSGSRNVNHDQSYFFIVQRNMIVFDRF